MGASKGKLIGQFIGESLMLSLISAFLAVIFMYLYLPAFNGIVEKKLAVKILYPSHLAALILIAVFC